MLDEICEKLSAVTEKTPDDEMKEVVDLLWDARSDYSIWKNGLDKTYKLYLERYPTTVSLKAVLLSIL